MEIEGINYKHNTLVSMSSNFKDMTQREKDALCDSIAKGVGPRSIKLDMVYSHTGKTINRRIYSIKGHQSVARDLADQENPKPLTLNHIDMVENIVGRFKSAKYVPMIDEATKYFNKRRISINKLNDMLTASNELDYEKLSRLLRDTRLLTDPSWKGFGRVEASLNITDANAMVNFINGTWFNFSAEQQVDGYVCSHCLQDWRQKGMCEHMPGEVYDGEMAFIMCGDSQGLASSVVVQPADRGSKVINISLNDKEEDFFETIRRSGILDTNESEGIITMDNINVKDTDENQSDSNVVNQSVTTIDLTKIKDNEIEEILLPLVKDKFISPLESQIENLNKSLQEKDSLIATKDTQISDAISKNESLKTADAIAYKLVNDKLQATLAGFVSLNDKANLLLDSLKQVSSILGSNEEIKTLDQMIEFIKSLDLEKLKKKIDHGMTNVVVTSTVDSPVIENNGQEPVANDNEQYKKYFDRYNKILDMSGELAANSYWANLKDKKFIPDTLSIE